MLILLTGARGIGKSTVCAMLARRARLAGHSVGGVLALARYDAAGIKTAIELIDLATGERRLQASAVANLGGARVGRYSMDDMALAWGADAILRAVEVGCELVVVDEIGPLELEKGAGLAVALPALVAHPQTSALVVVRPELAEQAARRLVARAPQLMAVLAENRDDMPALLDHLFWPGEPPRGFR